MKISIVTATAVIALSSAAFAQGQLNGSTLGQSQPGVNAGVPYPNPAVTNDPAPERAAPVDTGSAQQVQATAPPKPHQKPRKKKPVPAKDNVTPTNSPSPDASSPR